MRKKLIERDISYWMCASRNHLLPKNGKAPRPKFHVYLPLSQALYDGGKFVHYCLWCIKTFDSDKNVKSRAQKMFGYGDNPNAFVDNWCDGRHVDEVVSEDDLAVAASSVVVPKSTIAPSLPPMSPADMVAAVQRAIAYIAKMQEANQGDNGSSATLRVCNKLYEFGLDWETAKQIIMTYYNPRCVPPWSEKEIDHKLNTAYYKPLKPAGCMLGSRSVTQATPIQQTAASTVQQGLSPEMRIRSFDEIDDTPPVWFMPNKIPAYDISLLSGDGAVGKTYFVCHMAHHIWDGLFVL